MSRRRDGLERRDALLDAALRCFSGSGILAVGIEEIRREANANPSSVYNLFSNIGDLTLALLVRTFERLFSHLAERVVETKSAKAIVTTLVEAHIEWILGHPDQGRFMYQATALELVSNAREDLLRRKTELLAPIAEHLKPFVQTGQLPDWSVLQFDVVLLGSSHEACRRFLAGAPLDASWMRSTLPRLAWRSIAAELSSARRGGRQ
jgi:AcrR family transcriptional regulator